MISSQPYTDQIWSLSGCVQFERDLNRFFKQTFNDHNIHFQLVDAVNENYKDYKLVVTDNVIPNFEYQSLYPEYWGSFSYNPQYKNNIPTRLFNCFINRTDPIRQSWFYQLVRRNLIDQGSVSFLLDYQMLPDGISKHDKDGLYQWVFDQGCEIFAKEHEQMRTQVPFQNFSGDLDQVMCDSRVGLVIETYFDRPDVIAFSEKIFRALQLPRPFLLYCCPGAINAIRSCGFNVYDDIIDHSYDLEKNDIHRQVLLLDKLEKSKDIIYTNQTLKEFEQRAEHNRALLRQLKDNWPNKLKKVISEIDKNK